MTVKPSHNAAVAACLEALGEAFLLDVADSPDDEQVLVGRFLIEVFEADERGYDFSDDLRDFYLSAAELRDRARLMRERHLARPQGADQEDILGG